MSVDGFYRFNSADQDKKLAATYDAETGLHTLKVALEVGASPTGGLTNAELRATEVPVSIATTVPVSIAAAVPVTGAFFQLTQPVSIAAPVAVTGTFYQPTQPVSIASAVAVTGDFYPPTQPVSIAASLAVTGPLTDLQLRASNINVAVQNFPATQPVSAVTLPLPSGAATESTLALVATATKQDTGNTSLASVDAKIGTLDRAPAAFTMLERLMLIDKKFSDLLAKVATESTLQKFVARPAQRPTGTLLHRSF